MAIEFDCPNCGERYRLRDDVGGKKAKCKNPQCGKMMLIPQAKRSTVPPTTPPPDVEATALTALTELPEKKDDAPAVQDIPLTCTSCDHHWAVPIAMAGKNVICPECSHRIKVPLPKKHIETDWRQGANSGKPSLAKENFEKPKDVISSEGSVVSREAWQKGGGADADLEPIPLKRRLMVIVPIVFAVVAVAYGIVSWWSSRVHDNEAKLFAEAQKEFGDGSEAPSGSAPLLAALLHLAEAEYVMRDTKQEKFLGNSLLHLSNSRADLSLGDIKDANQRTQAAAERNALGCELALFTLDFGGTDEQVKANARIRWIPEQATRKLRVNEKSPPTVHDELRRTLSMLKPAEFDLKAVLARRLTREFVKRGQAGMAEDLSALLFEAPEQDDARALIALELFRLNAGGSRPIEVSNELVGRYSGKGAPPPPGYVQGLWLSVPPSTVKRLPGVAPLGTGTISDATRIAYTCQLLMQDKPTEAFAVANRPGDPLPRMRALLLCAEWSPDPIPALDAARAVIPKFAGSTSISLQSATFRLSQIAAIAGRPDLANSFAETIADDGLNAWAKGEAVRWRMTPENKAPADEAWIEVPSDPKKVRVGHAWGRLWIARQNARLSGDLSKEKKGINGWPNVTIHPFGLAGIALGLQDRQ